MRVAFPVGLLLLPYVPVGLLIMVLRIFIYPHALLASFILMSCGAAKRFVLRIMCAVLGLVVRISTRKVPVEEQKNLPIISNHITLFDHLLICLSRDTITPHRHVFHWYSSFSETKSSSVRNEVEQNVPSTFSVSFSRSSRNFRTENVIPMQFFPELTPSDSPEHLLLFDSSVFESLDKVQPVALHASRPFPVKLIEYPITWYSEWLWHLFVPFTYYHIEYLEPIGRLPDETAVNFADRVRIIIATALNVGLSDVTADHLNDRGYSLASNGGSVSTTRSSSSAPSTSTFYPRSSLSFGLSSSTSSEHACCESDGLRFRGPLSDATSIPPIKEQDDDEGTVFDHLIPVVQEVLAGAPLPQIRRALITCNGDVDSAIEALVTSVNEDLNRAPQFSDDTNIIPASRLNMAAEEFCATSRARQQSLEERRQILINHARQRFLALQPSQSS